MQKKKITAGYILCLLASVVVLGGCVVPSGGYNAGYEHPNKPSLRENSSEAYYTARNSNTVLYDNGKYAEIINAVSPKCGSDCANLGRHEFYLLCSAYSESRDYGNFLKNVKVFLDKYLPTRQNPNDDVYELAYCSVLLSMRAGLYLETGKQADAMSDIERAVKILDTRPNSLRFLLGWMTDRPYKIYAQAGLIYFANGDTEKAMRMINRIDSTNVGRGGMGMNRYVTMLKDAEKAKIYMAMHRFADAYSILIRDDISSEQSKSVLSVFRNEYLRDITNVYLKQFMIGKCLFELGRFDEAQQRYSVLLESKNIQDFGGLYYIILTDMATISRRQGNITDAVARLEQAIRVIESQRLSINTEASKIGFVSDKQQAYGDLITILIESGNAPKAFEYAERGKSRALVDMLGSKRSFATGSKRRQSANDSQQVTSLVSVQYETAAQVQERLLVDETLVEYYGAGAQLVAFIVTRQGIKAITLDGNQLADEVSAFRQDIQDYTSKKYMVSAKKLYDRLIDPVEPYLKTSKLTIVGHGSLHYLPFNALHDGTNFMVEKYSMRTLPAASVMAYLNKTSAGDGSLLIFSNPDLGDAGWDLPAAGAEGKVIAKQYPNARHLTRKGATETALRQYGPTASWLHIASHGKFNSDQPLESGLLLAGDSSNDGNLTVGDLYDLELNNDLVTLSACETGLGQIKNGDDIIGLTRGFLFAGANSIVASLWMVDDTATAKLMVNFYAGLTKYSRQESLRKAQIKVMESYNEHPFFWASFQLTGVAWTEPVTNMAAVDTELSGLMSYTDSSTTWTRNVPGEQKRVISKTKVKPPVVARAQPAHAPETRTAAPAKVTSDRNSHSVQKQAPPVQTRVVAEPPRDKRNFPPTLGKYINLLETDSYYNKSIAAKGIYKRYATHVGALKVVETELLKGYKMVNWGKYETWSMCALCKILGRSGDSKYIKTLETVQVDSTNARVRQVAGKYLQKLR